MRTRGILITKDYDHLRLASIYIRKWIEKQKTVKEESLTDWLLYDISTNSNRIIYSSFTKNEEATITGADWEWWFIFKKYSYRFRVQAKKIKSASDNYASIAYTNKYGLQIEKLIVDSNNNNSLPLYAFYTDKVDKVKCKANIIDEGVYFAGANRLYKKLVLPGKKKVDCNDILEEAIPLSCMFGCPLSSNMDIGDSFDVFISRYFDSEFMAQTSNEKIKGQYLQVPNYVSSLIESHEQKVPEWWEKEFSRQIKDINGILIFDGRSD